MATTARGREDHDDALLRELSGPPPLDEAREALAYWERRALRLPRRRVRARREARAMAATWRARVREAELAALGDGPLAPLRRLFLRPRPGLARWARRALVAVTAASIALCATLVAIVHALLG